MKNIFREKNSRHKNLRFRHFHQNLNDEISDFPRKYFFIKIFFIEKKRFSRKFIFFLQIHAISFYVTKYDHITPNSLGSWVGLKIKQIMKKVSFFYPRATAKTIGSYVTIFGDIEAYIYEEPIKKRSSRPFLNKVLSTNSLANAIRHCNRVF